MSPTTAMRTAHGRFDVKLAPQPADDAAGGAAFSRLLLDKRFHGDLDATSAGQMIAHRTAVEGSAGYVAMKLVTGTLFGRRGSFVLQHSCTMQRGAPTQDITVVPDSGTDALVGLGGRMTIAIDGGAHSYSFEYSLAPLTPGA